MLAASSGTLSDSGTGDTATEGDLLTGLHEHLGKKWKCSVVGVVAPSSQQNLVVMNAAGCGVG